jgi:putative phage-type endonuclease
MSKSESWHKDRLRGLGGSDIAAALGVSPWKTQLELWGEKTGLAPSTFEGNEATEWGEKMESLLMAKYEEMNTGERILVEIAKEHPDYPFMRANVDGIIVDRSEGVRSLGIWEGKTAQKEWTEVPVNYQLQVQHYMFVFDLPFAVISVLFHGNMYREFKIERDPLYESELLPKLQGFWESVKNKIPAFRPTSMEDLNIRFNSAKLDRTASLDEVEHYTGLLERTLSAKVNYAKAKAKFDKLKLELTEKMLSDKLKSITVNDKSVATIVKVDDSVTFDMAAFKGDYPTRHAEYMTKKRRGYTSLRVTS